MKDQEKTGTQTKNESDSSSKKIAIIRIRGTIGLKTGISDTLSMLKLYRKNYCVVYPSTNSVRGMINKIKDYVTWGEIDQETLSLLREKRLEKTKDKKGKEVEKKFFRLHPPKGGFEKKGIKKPFSINGVLGNRKEKINELIKKMI